MYNNTIMLNTLEKAREFVDSMNKYSEVKLDLKSGDYCIDGHSIIGVISLDISKPIELVASGEITDEFVSIVSKYAI